MKIVYSTILIIFIHSVVHAGHFQQVEKYHSLNKLPITSHKQIPFLKLPKHIHTNKCEHGPTKPKKKVDVDFDGQVNRLEKALYQTTC